MSSIVPLKIPSIKLKLTAKCSCCVKTIGEDSPTDVETDLCDSKASMQTSANPVGRRAPITQQGDAKRKVGRETNST